MPAPDGFSFEVRGDAVVISHRGQRAAVLRGARARGFLQDVETSNPQELMARLTGNYRRGNERVSRNHPRNQDR